MFAACDVFRCYARRYACEVRRMPDAVQPRGAVTDMPKSTRHSSLRRAYVRRRHATAV